MLRRKNKVGKRCRKCREHGDFIGGQRRPLWEGDLRKDL